MCVWPCVLEVSKRAGFLQKSNQTTFLKSGPIQLQAGIIALSRPVTTQFNFSFASSIIFEVFQVFCINDVRDFFYFFLGNIYTLIIFMFNSLVYTMIRLINCVENRYRGINFNCNLWYYRETFFFFHYIVRNLFSSIITIIFKNYKKYLWYIQLR